ncbi:MAG: exo-alpha-sialidase [Thermoguttaceae bacterium]|nr:exo-alpha-sialidase [Thermoguttaceae bacterium]
MSLRTYNRREFLARGTSAAVLGAFATPFISKFAYGASATPKYEILETKTISFPGDCYYGWPTVAKRGAELLVVTSGGREGHVCPFGRVELFRSHDNGATWTYPQVIYDSPIDDRDAGICVTDKGTILVTTFTSMGFVDMVMEEKNLRDQGKGRPEIWSDGRFDKWMRVCNRISDEQKKSDLGCWMFRSTDGGVTWSERYATPFNSPHGPIQLSNGTLLYVGDELVTPEHRVGASVSEDDGQTWQIKGYLEPRDGDDIHGYYELHAVEADDGRIVAQIRNGNQNNPDENLQTVSKDGGATWTKPRAIGVWGIPSFLMKLKDGRLLMTYGYRRAPLGVKARVSDDNGDTWSEEMTVYAEGKSGDIGYPSTVQLDDGSLYTVWYEVQEGWFAKLRAARWSID